MGVTAASAAMPADLLVRTGPPDPGGTAVSNEPASSATPAIVAGSAPAINAPTTAVTPAITIGGTTRRAIAGVASRSCHQSKSRVRSRVMWTARKLNHRRASGNAYLRPGAGYGAVGKSA